MPAERSYWFPAKRYGWGWGLPTCWQGWVVYALFVLLVTLGLAFFPPQRHLVAFLVYVLALSAVVGAICWLKGEPPRWRWGDKSQ